MSYLIRLVRRWRISCSEAVCCAWKSLYKNLRCPRDVIPAKQLCSRAIASDHGVEDRDVLAQDGLRHLSIVSQHFAHDAAQIRPMGSGGLAY